MKDRTGSLCFRSTLVALIVATCAQSAHAASARALAKEGVEWVEQGRCDLAIPLLEEAELLEHRPYVSLALADCYAAEGKLVDAIDIYQSLADTPITRKLGRSDRKAIKQGSLRLKDVEERVPLLILRMVHRYDGLKVLIDGRVVDDPLVPIRVQPNKATSIVAIATGYETFSKNIRLAERERLALEIELKKRPTSLHGGKKAKSTSSKQRSVEDDRSERGGWFSVRAHMYVIPKFVWGWFAEGGRTVVAPGGTLGWTIPMRRGNLGLGFGYTSYGMKPTPVKGNGLPDTDWEIVESSLHSFVLSVEWAWRIPMSSTGEWDLMVGAGAGVGGFVAGKVTRTQAYPPNHDMIAGNPYNYRKCKGPNDPRGTYLYCNALDTDLHYYDYAEPNWFVGGKVPIVYPWISLPKLALAYNPSKAISVDLEFGVTTGGLLTAFGMRFR